MYLTSTIQSQNAFPSFTQFIIKEANKTKKMKNSCQERKFSKIDDQCCESFRFFSLHLLKRRSWDCADKFCKMVAKIVVNIFEKTGNHKRFLWFRSGVHGVQRERD